MKISRNPKKADPNLAPIVPDPSLSTPELAAKNFEQSYPPAGTEKTGQGGQGTNVPLNVPQNIPTSRKRLSAQDFLEQPDPEWIIKGILPARGIGQIFGPSGSGKSFLALDIVAHVGRGMDFYGRKTIKRPCVYAVLEGGGAFKNRIRAWQDKNGTFADNVLFDLNDLQLASEESIDSFIRGIPQGALVVIDTQACASLTLDENSARDANIVAEALNRIADACQGFCLAIHHSGKDTTKGARGSSAFRAAMDTCIEVTPGQTWKVEKQKDGPSGMEYAFRLDKIVLGIDTDGDEVASLVAVPDTERQENLEKRGDKRGTKKLCPGSKLGLSTLEEAIAEEGQAEIHIEKWRSHYYRRHTGDTQAAKKKAFKRARENLADIGLIRVINDFYKLTEQGGTKGTRGTNGTNVPLSPSTHNPASEGDKIGGQQPSLERVVPFVPLMRMGNNLEN